MFAEVLLTQYRQCTEGEDQRHQSQKLPREIDHCLPK